MIPKSDPSPAQLVDATERALSARVVCFARLDDPLPEPIDLRGEGIADFKADSVWMWDQVLTTRMESEQRKRANVFTRPLVRFLNAGYERVLGGKRQIMFKGGSVRRRQRNGDWSDPQGSVSDPKFPRHPLCALEPIAKARTLEDASRYATQIRGLDARVFQILLTQDEFDTRVWQEILGGPQAGGNEGSIVALVWVDSAFRIMRIAFEGSRRYEGTLWSITEFVDFGVDIPSEGLSSDRRPV